MKTILAIMGVLVAAFVLTMTLEGAYALKQENEQKAVQLQKANQGANDVKQAGFANKNGNDLKQDQKTFQKSDNWAKCTFAFC